MYYEEKKNITTIGSSALNFMCTTRKCNDRNTGNSINKKLSSSENFNRIIENRIILLYNIENYDAAAKIGILYNNNLIVTLE